MYMQDFVGFLENLQNFFEIRPLRNHYGKRKNQSICLLRHDVYNDLDKALQMAKLENGMGIKGTFFITPSKKHTVDGPVQDIRGLGHEIGLHNDVLTHCLSSRRVGYAKRLFESELKLLKNSGISKISGVSSHNSEACAKYGVDNHDIFKEYSSNKKPERVKHTDLFTLSLKKYGLYEADMLFHDHTFTDSGGGWNNGELNNLGIHSYLHGLANGSHTVIQIIIHPLEWTL